MSPRKPTRILFCETNVDGTVGGSYYSLLYLIKGLDRTRYRPTVVFYTDHSLIPAFRDAGAETVVWPRGVAFAFTRGVPGPLRPLAVAAQRGINLLRGFVAPTIARARFIRERAITIVHLNNSILYNHDWMAAARLAGARCVSHERGINERYPLGARLFGRQLDAIICISHAVAENMRNRGAGFSNLRTIHNGLDPTTMKLFAPPAQLRTQMGIGPTDPTVVMIGNLKEWKGQRTVVDAMDRVRRVNPAARCVFVGATSAVDAAYERSLRDTVERLQLGRNVIFAGYQSAVADFIMMSDMIVHASVLPEPFGRVILEGMACRKPVVGSRGGAITELVVDGETGLTFAPGDPEGLANAILRLISDPGRARAMGEAGYDRLVREFHIDRNVQATERVYAEVLRAH